MTQLDDLKQYMKSTLAGSYSDAELTGVLTTEIAAQKSRVRLLFQMTDWSTHPAPLREAILRRCVRNLAARKLPLGIAESEVAPLRLSTQDPEVRRLEAPYLRLVVA